MNLYGYIPESVNEGPGLRAVLFISGCRHACPGCFSPSSWSFRAGEPLTEERQQQILHEVTSHPLLEGVTLCGGDPFFSAAECASWVRQLRAARPDLTVWAYTGFVYEELITDPSRAELSRLCDVIIDGPYIAAERDVSLPFRGSRNQRIVNVGATMAGQTIVTMQLDAW
ncbi:MULTISPECIES: anaerobic ribonucleoside-triphosphate reductase activating protein [unclassified Paenibacillus]|uniref:anaerobic ribonucleoside-triphosphate reductase activating protein n=1 Tax=unclassified Paenibacillus TaxID=185978 RepID=UPI0009A90D15|nr:MULTISPECIES: anaerobic ribonucleoside-triphosphate reductase activating protein [unclassified Paenibacillus]SLK06349.1 anaerobic ribonucleoside-triphosphate reductase activating protein [Paenibacillus sp. RU5A]SOC70526.1 anaerobic ribonucleoside-triphosphate reductase activating protein [Paenibacillus sp. RU26A]SOC72651.1 anaerobic ribonucleoside-triphosphate reductase activating protein [Paenibacillus sp. RU5M]